MAPPLEFGIAFHKGMEVLYSPETWEWDREVVGSLAIKTFIDTCREQKRQYLLDSNNVALEPAVQDEYNERVELGKGMLQYYYRQQLPMYPDKFKPVKVEIAFEVPILHPDTGMQLYCRCVSCVKRYTAHQKLPGNDWEHFSAADIDKEFIYWKGLPVVYAGRIDAIGEDEHGDYWIIDWKTAAQISADDEFLELDDQIGSYVWALRAMLGLPIRGFIYHEQRKGYPQAPQRNKVNRLGCWYSISKTQTTDYDTYLDTIKTGDSEGYARGAYDDFLEYLQKEGIQYHKRWVITKTAEQLKEIGYNIGLETLDMIDPGLRIYPSSGKFGCKYCAFRQPCLEKNSGLNPLEVLKVNFKQEPPYYYRQTRGASTESKGGE